MTKKAQKLKKRRNRSPNLATYDSWLKIVEIFKIYRCPMTVRQVYYQFLTRGYIPEDKKCKYEYVSNLLKKARWQGEIGWQWIIDRSRTTHRNSHFESPSDILETAAKNYKLDSRSNQENYIEIWIEKDALIGVIEKTCCDLDVLYTAGKGYPSVTALHQAAKRFEAAKNQAKNVYILYLGDHDPSGLNMTDTIRKNLLEHHHIEVNVERLALNFSQIEKYKLPSIKAKRNDKRFKEYYKEYGTDEAWELDALEPGKINELIKIAVNRLTDCKLREERLIQQKFDLEELVRLIKYIRER